MSGHGHGGEGEPLHIVKVAIKQTTPITNTVVHAPMLPFEGLLGSIFMHLKHIDPGITPSGKSDEDDHHH
jgi:hypothetical protein